MKCHIHDGSVRSEVYKSCHFSTFPPTGPYTESGKFPHRVPLISSMRIISTACLSLTNPPFKLPVCVPVCVCIFIHCDGKNKPCCHSSFLPRAEMDSFMFLLFPCACACEYCELLLKEHQHARPPPLSASLWGPKKRF